ncbi:MULTISPECIES: magnesium transporter CorA family protein [Paenibacillus]|uniref:Magnesium transport protein CorA n=1 Tax=Paenibacillus albilobatus TaxID=2716884 RepID=A0A919XNU6_9BACL|nr:MULTISPECIES: magnesium transporter CorA family protein [Paenibacillus]GIO34215.1 magnesium transport protein CorA [Paenibacillus albilobatus]
MNNASNAVQHRLLNFAGGWRWYDLVSGESSANALRKLRLESDVIDEWLRVIPEVSENYISVRFPDGVNAVIFGTLPYSVNSEVTSVSPVDRLHFFVQENMLVTINMDPNTREMMEDKERSAMLQQCQTAVDGMFVLARTLLHYFHQGLDRFEVNLRSIERAMELDNQRHLMDKILNSRFELLFWSNLFTPFDEFIAAAREGYLERLEKSRQFLRLIHRMERMTRAFRHYEDEIDTLISIDEAVSAFRGNEIMKTLTIVTSIFTPATVVGAIWGMNFDNLPAIKTPWGFISVMFATFLFTLGMYWWMHRKGWTGDLLRVKGRKSKI